jgi:hypothetical protein
MKRQKIKVAFCIIVFALLLNCFKGFAQKEKLSIGTTYQLNTIGLSINHSINSNSSIQVDLNPISLVGSNLKYFGGRYSYALGSISSTGWTSPYVFASSGLVTANNQIEDLTNGNIVDRHESALGLNFGVGFKWFRFGGFEYSTETGYAFVRVMEDSSISTGLSLGMALRYYIK